MPRNTGKAVGLPPRMFLYTLDQVAELLSMPLDRLKRDYIWWHGRSVGRSPSGFIMARNIAPPDAPPEWRVAEHELVRWMKSRGFRFYERGWVTS